MNVYFTRFELSSSLGNDQLEFWNNLIDGKSGVRELSSKNDFSDKINQACVLADDKHLPPLHENRYFSEVCSSFSYLLNKLVTQVDRRTKISSFYWASGQLGQKPSHLYDQIEKNEQFVSGYLFDEFCQKELKQVGLTEGNNLRVVNHANACISGFTLIQSAAKRIRSGEEKSVLIFLNEARCRDWLLKPYFHLGLLSTSARKNTLVSSPYSDEATGFLKGEGSVLLLLEGVSSVAATTNKISAELIDIDTCSDGMEIIKATPTSDSFFDMIKKIFSRSKIETSSCDFIHGYGSGSKSNDSFEIDQYKKIFQANSKKPLPLSCIKPQVGHLNTACIGLELAATFLMMENRTIIPNWHLESDLQHGQILLPNKLDSNADLNLVLKTGFSFGWSSGGMLLKKYPQR